MKIRRRLFRSVLCLAQAGFLISGNAAVFAAPSALDAKLDLLDKQVFGEEHKSMKQSAKLRALELNLFGNEHDGNLSSRVEEIAKALNYKGGDLLLPPMAPQLDTSGGHTLSTAPDAHAASPIYDSRATDTASGAAPPASKQVLRSAMQAYSQGKTDEAERLFRQVLSMDRKSTDAYYNLGVIAESRGDLEGALNNYRSAERLSPLDHDFEDAVNTVQNKLQSQVASKAQQREEQAQASSAAQEQQKVANLKGSINEAASAYKAGNYDKAISNLEYVSKQAPQDPDVLYALGQAYKGKGNMGAARSAFGRAIAIEPNNQLYKNAMGDLDKVASRSRAPLGDVYNNNNNSPGQLTSFANDQSNGGGNSAASSSPTPFSAGGPDGGVTPFTGLAENPTGGARGFSPGGGSNMGGGLLSAAALLGGVRMLSGGMGGGMGGMGGGMGMPMMGGMGMGGMGMGMPMGYGSRGYSSTGTRIKRAAVGSLAGAAMGAIFGATTHSGMQSGAMKGALMGGAMSLFMR